MVVGKYINEINLPYDLTESGFEKAKTALSNLQLEIITNGLENYLTQQSTGLFDKYSLSDFSSYCDQSAFNAVLRLVIQKAGKRAWFCLRHLYHKCEISQENLVRIERETDLENRLFQQDLASCYRFVAGKIINNT